MNKTNVMRLLDAAKIPYRTAEYEFDESDLGGCTPPLPSACRRSRSSKRSSRAEKKTAIWYSASRSAASWI